MLGRALQSFRSSMIVPHLLVFFASLASFAEQPLVGRMLLPIVGGGAGAWVASLVFFQSFLIGGYLLGSWLGKRDGRWGLLLFLGVAAGPLVIIPVVTGSMLGVFSAMWLIIPGFVVLTSTLILMSERIVRVFPERNPYRLAASSNAGSFMGLFAGLLVTEFIALSQARYIWWGLLFLVVTGVVTLVYPLRGRVVVRKEEKVAEEVPAGNAVGLLSGVAAMSHRKQWWVWATLSGLASGLLVAYTAWVNESMVVMPLLWVLPLAGYLAVFSLVFSGMKMTERFSAESERKTMVVGVPVVVGIIGVLALTYVLSKILFAVLVGLLLFLVATWLVISKLESVKPSMERLSGFWIAVSVGGALGGFLMGVVAPFIFPAVWELYPLFLIPFLFMPIRDIAVRRGKAGRRMIALVSALCLLLVWFSVVSATDTSYGNAAIHVSVLGAGGLGVACFYALFADYRKGWIAAVAAVAVFSLIPILGSFAGKTVIAQGRNLYGSWVVYDEVGEARNLAHGGITHGVQYENPAWKDKPAAYYGAGTSMGVAMEALRKHWGEEKWADTEFAIIGLGVGSMVGWSVEGQRWNLLEIDPDMVNVAETYFDYLPNMKAKDVTTIVGDARLTLAELPDGSQDVIVFDAYLGDSVPTHLLTQESYALAKKKLAPDGVILTHVSNKYLDIESVALGSSEAAGLTSVVLAAGGGSGTVDTPPTLFSHWVLSTTDQDVIEVAKEAGWTDSAMERIVWTDELTPFLKVVRWGASE